MPDQENQPQEGAEKSEVEEVGDIETLKHALEQEREKSEKYLANWQRAQADYINYKKRAEQERNEIGSLACAAIILNVLPAIDDLERAMVSVPPQLSTISWVDGIRLVCRKLQSILEAQSITPIKTKGEKFDPIHHQAVLYQEGGQEGIVVEEIQKGYKFRDKVLRPALVAVSKGQEQKKEGEPA